MYKTNSIALHLKNCGTDRLQQQDDTEIINKTSHITILNNFQYIYEIFGHLEDLRNSANGGVIFWLPSGYITNRIVFNSSGTAHFLFFYKFVTRRNKRKREKQKKISNIGEMVKRYSK